MTANCARRPYINHIGYISEGMLVVFIILTVLTVNLWVIKLIVCCLLFTILL